MKAICHYHATKLFMLLSFFISSSADPTTDKRSIFGESFGSRRVGVPDTNSVRISTVEELNRAVSESKSGDFIRLAPGTYELNRVLHITVPKITISGLHPEDTILKCVPENILGSDFKNDPESAGIVIEADGVTLQFLAVHGCRNRVAVLVQRPETESTASRVDRPALRALTQSDNDFEAKVTIHGCRFEDNRLEHPDCCAFGAAILLFRMKAVINKCVFIDNYSRKTGAAIFAGESSVTIMDTGFYSNAVATDGGVISAFHCPFLKLVRCNMENSLAGDGLGGAMLAMDTNEVVIDKCRFHHNRIEIGSGGALATKAVRKLSITKSRFTQNGAKRYGGAMFMTETDAVINRTTISDNISEGHGAALFFNTTSGNKLVMERFNLAGNMV